LIPDLTSADLPNLSLSDHRQCLNADQRSSGRPEAAKPRPEQIRRFIASMVLLNNIVQVLDLE
jgi:hypothetical protein